ncbi:uncharacterized protein [Typha angustifolia]|uniref:uncharacterized protein isoform X2 n=1 Tax=Typha angustifolia TaxID=59011 RepID=UPI003C2ADA29
MEGFQNRKGQDLQRPFVSCMGRMINIFDLSAGMTGTKLLTEKAHRDGSPVGRNRLDNMKMPMDPSSVQRKENQTASELWKNSSNKRFGGTPMKMLIEQEMLKEAESKQNPPNVVARLMGLDGLPVQQSDLISRSISREDYLLDGLAGDHRRCNQQENKYPQNSMPHKRQSCTQRNKEYKDVYEILQKPLRISSKHKHPVKGKYEENTYEKRMDLIRQKFIQAKHMAADEKLLHSNEFQEALQGLSSNRDLFLKFLEEPNSLFSKHLHELQTVAPPSEINRITVLKPSKIIEMKDNKIMGKQLDLDGRESEDGRSGHYRSSSCSPTETHVLLQPTRIVVLKPSLRKPHDIKTVTSSPISSPTSVEGRESYEVQEADEVAGSREVAKEITRRVRESLKCKQRGAKPFSSGYSNGYIEQGSSFKWSESENMDEEDSELNGWEIGTPTSHHSCDNKSRTGSPYSVSSFSRTSHSTESSVVKEAKKRLSERWAMVASNAYSQEGKEARRSSSTLGEMLAIPEVKKEQEMDVTITLSSRACEHDLIQPTSCLSAGWTKEESIQENANKNLSRSKSLPVCSSVYDDVGLNCGASGSLSGNLKEADKSKSGKSLFMETVSNLFLSKNKKPVRQKSLPFTSVGSNNWVQHNCFLSVGKVNNDIDQCILNSQYKQTTSPDPENKIVKAPATLHYDIPDKGTITTKDVSSMDKLGMSGNFLDTQDQPSPISVLEAPFMDDSMDALQKLSESSSAGTPQTLSRSPRIESVARSLSWDNSQFEVTSPNSLRLSRVFSKADEEQKRFAFIQKLVWSAGLDAESSSTKYLRWYSPDRPLSPYLLDEHCDDKEEGVKIREKRAKERLLYDSVNKALIEIGQTTLLARYPWTSTCMWTCKGCSSDSGSSVADEVWAVIRNWTSFEKFFTWESNNSSLVVDLMVKREITGRMWVQTIWFEMYDLNKEICGLILEELVEEAMLDLSCW